MTKLTFTESTSTGYSEPVRFLKLKFRTGLLCLFFLLSFSSLKYLPGMLITSEIWFVTVFIFLLTLYFPGKLIQGFKFSSLELYGILLLIYVPLISAFMANSEFDQPWIYGILAQRGIVLVGCMMMFLHFYRKQRFSLEDVERALLWLAWFNLILCSVGLLTLDPSHFADMPTFVTGGEIGESKFKFDITFIVFGFFYYAFSGFWQKSPRHLFLSLLFFGYLVFGSGGRTLLIAVTISYLFFIGRWSSSVKFLVYLSKISMLTALLATIFYATNYEKFNILYEKFNAAFMVALTGEEGEDSSANARIIESAIALPYINKHWALGNGTISNQWNEGYKSLFGYFYPTDIGLLGIIYLYGIVGLILFAYQFRFALRYSKRLPNNGGRRGMLISAIKGFLLFYAIASLVTGQFVGSVEHDLIMIAILYCAAKAEGHGVRVSLTTRDKP